MLCGSNLIKRINTRVVFLVRYSEPFLKGTMEELTQMDQKTRKSMTMHKALHPRDDIDRLHVSRNKRGKDLPSLKIASIHLYKDSKTTLKRKKE